MWFTCLTTTKLITFFRLDKFFHNFFAEVALTVSRMARLLFLLFVFDTSKNWLQMYSFFRKYANKFEEKSLNEGYLVILSINQ